MGYRLTRKTAVAAIGSLAFLLCSCSWSIRFYILNSSASPRTITIEVEKTDNGFIIFNPRHFSLLPFTDEKPDYEQIKPLPRAQSLNTIEIPAYTALEIGHLTNDRYENSRQRFNNGRVFNLKKIQAGNSEVTKENFDSYFKNRNYARVWELP